MFTSIATFWFIKLKALFFIVTSTKIWKQFYLEIQNYRNVTLRTLAHLCWLTVEKQKYFGTFFFYDDCRKSHLVVLIFRTYVDEIPGKSCNLFFCFIWFICSKNIGHFLLCYNDFLMEFRRFKKCIIHSKENVTFK